MDNHDHQGMSRIINNTRPLLKQACIVPYNDVIFFMRVIFAALRPERPALRPWLSLFRAIRDYSLLKSDYSPWWWFCLAVTALVPMMQLRRIKRHSMPGHGKENHLNKGFSLSFGRLCRVKVFR
jgi:hypothetical protein